MKPDEKKELRHEHGQVAVLSFLLVSFGFVYALVVEYVRRSWRIAAPLATIDLSTVRVVTVLVLVAVFVASRIAANRILSARPSSADSPLTPEEKRERLRRSTIVTYLVFEFFMLVALVMFFLTGSPKDFYAIFSGTLALALINFPRFDAWCRQYEEMT